MRVYRGHPTSLVQELGFSLPYYTQMRQILLTLGCVKQIKRGAAKAQSEWILVRRPSEVDFDAVDPKGKREDTEFRLYQLATDAAIDRIESRLGGLDIVRAFRELQTRVHTLEKQLKERDTHGV